MPLLVTPLRVFPHSSSFSPPREWDSAVYPPTLAHQVTAVLGTFSTSEARQHSPVGEWIPQSDFRVEPPLLGDTKVDWASHLLHTCLGPQLRQHKLFGWWFNVWEPLRVQVSWLCWSPCGIYFPFRNFNLYYNFSMRVLDASPMFNSGYLHLSDSAAEFSLSEDNYARLLSASRTQYH